MMAERDGPKIVCVGGGHGLAAALRAARDVSPNVTAVVTVADDGGSSGVLRAQLGIPAPGDLRMAIAALTTDPQRKALIQYRFREGELAGHPLGNLLIAALADLRGDFGVAVDEVSRVAEIVGAVVPSTTTPVRLRALIAGEEVAGQVSIARGPAAVEKLWLEPGDAHGYDKAITALEQADLVVLGPGSLFTSVIAALLPAGICEATARAARVTLVMNLAEQAGETLGMDATQHVQSLLAHCPDLRLDAVIVHNASVFGIPRPVAVDESSLAQLRAPIVATDLRDDLRSDGPRHDSAKLAAILSELVR
ncbi:MAG TPA: uridine diphosphate-N-acetylglucosamine-binding protein YvcK [Actinomycetota bacterium]|nr:uridine diphosphate-N-acetylglucosamine-binding protein YvcK [Actinomycetota bacterium]